ncbi:helix-turn-helix domain-containing protein [Microbacterium murale]|uniref:AraC-like DNA-binding protein n=1 Tax=Microbacterium murale TaxID=1081040 RepID=A0ABU0P6N2_9MICO|nr:helix-turn-helix domain-containing protein [Microbacterium murale]MDQ0642995.1 AraC-like DNA-binding protein [Microbacterium murale]
MAIPPGIGVASDPDLADPLDDLVQHTERHGSQEIVVTEPGLWVRRGVAPTMPLPHRHDDLEINIVLRGQLDYLFGGTRITVPAGSVAVFWGATPHRLVNTDDDGDMCWVHVPLSTVLSWNLREADLSEVLLSRPIIVPASSLARDLETMFEAWQDELGTDGLETIALLEVQALIRRLLHRHRRDGEMPVMQPLDQPGASTVAMLAVTEMARFTVTHFREPISTVDIAAAAHLNANYATALFRRAIGSTIGEYLIRCRVAEAQRLLVTTRMTASDVAHAAGFGSQSSFYAQFTKRCGSSPSAYRARLH